MGLILDLNELRADPEPPSLAPQTALEQVVRRQLLADLREVFLLALKCMDDVRAITARRAGLSCASCMIISSVMPSLRNS